MNHIKNSLGIIILAAGKGTRMKSDKAKVLHPLSGCPMIIHVVDTALEVVDESDIVVVVGHQAESVTKVVLETAKARFAVQEVQKGTGHAVQCALPFLSKNCSHVVILSGDVPLISKSTIETLVDEHVNQNNDITVLGVCLENPYGYGRLVQSETGGVSKIVEEADAADHEKQINQVNSGVYCVRKDFLERSLIAVTPDNNQNEIYLTDIVHIASCHHKKIGLKICENSTEVMGVNTLQDLRNIEAMLLDS